MCVLKIYEGKEGYFKNTDDAINFIKENNFDTEVTVYDINDNDAYNKTHEIYACIKEYNKGKSLDEQILPTNPCGFRGILGCLGVQCYSIGLGTYKRNHNLLSLFTGWNDRVLDVSKENAEIFPSMKALSSLALISQMMRQEEE